MRLPVRLVLALAVALGGGTACGGLTDSDPEIPPLTPEPGDQKPTGSAPVSLSPQQGRVARTALQRYLRALGAGETAACGYLTEEYETAAFGEPGGCRTGLAQARREMDEADLLALRTVRVPVGEPGPRPGEFTVRFADLDWRAAPAQPGGLLEARFVLRRSGTRWRVAP